MTVIAKATYQSRHREFHVNHGQNNVLTATQWYQHILNWRTPLITAEIHVAQDSDHGVLQAMRIGDGYTVVYQVIVYQVKMNKYKWI